MILAQRLKLAGFRTVYYEDPLIHDTMYSLAEIRRKQHWGATAVSSAGWTLMGQDRNTLVREQIGLGLKGMLVGLVRRDWTWLGMPILLGTKVSAYGETLLRRRLDRARNKS
jgi:hypothetical protein